MQRLFTFKHSHLFPSSICVLWSFLYTFISPQPRSFQLLTLFSLPSPPSIYSSITVWPKGLAGLFLSWNFPSGVLRSSTADWIKGGRSVCKCVCVCVCVCWTAVNVMGHHTVMLHSVSRQLFFSLSCQVRGACTHTHTHTHAHTHVHTHSETLRHMDGKGYVDNCWDDSDKTSYYLSNLWINHCSSPMPKSHIWHLSPVFIRSIVMFGWRWDMKLLNYESFHINSATLV